MRANRTVYTKSKRFCLFLGTDDSQVIAALRAGARGVVDDTGEDASNMDDLINGLIEVGSGGFFIPDRIAKRLVLLNAKMIDTLPVTQRDESLTKREQEVLSLLANGCDSREIALRLFLSEHTVRAHLRGIMQKLQVTSQAQAVAVAWKSKLVQSV
jgi:DNA-binding NarL/FixJ family response regulator